MKPKPDIAAPNTTPPGTERPEIAVSGVIVPGHRVASGQSATSPYPSGTIEMQTPHFLKMGIDLSAFYPGTLNVDISPLKFELRPQKTLHQVKWSPHHAAESFSFVPVSLSWQQQAYSGLIYYPHPETKLGHFQSPSVLELLLPKLQGIAYGRPVALSAPASELIVANL